MRFSARMFILGGLLTATGPAIAQCRSGYDLSALHLQDFSDPTLARAAESFRAADAQNAVNQAKAAGYDEESAYHAAMAQSQMSAQAADQSFESAKQASSDPAEIDRQRMQGLSADTTCSGAAGAAVCAGAIQQWTAEISKQTAEIIQCVW